jgi:hypothetical protein
MGVATSSILCGILLHLHGLQFHVCVKLSECATRNGIQYRAAWNRYKAAKIDGAYLDDSGHVVVPDPQHALIGKAAVYARVSTH